MTKITNNNQDPILAAFNNVTITQGLQKGIERSNTPYYNNPSNLSSADFTMLNRERASDLQAWRDYESTS